ncbi:hypothetical protein ACFE04_004847 [Oxalis oulophora]
MEKKILLLLLVLVAFGVSCADDDSKVINDGANANTSLDPTVNGTKTGTLLPQESIGSNLEDNSTSNGKLGDQVTGSSERLGSKEDTKGDNTQNGGSGIVKSDAGVKGNQVTETRGNEGCDSSNKCTDDENNFVACLRVPGDDSSDGSVLSLLIRNTGKSPISIAISAPSFVNLETSKVLLEGKRDTKVKVSVREKGSSSLITLKAGKGQCSLDFKDLYMHSSSEESVSNSNKLAYSNIISRKSIIAFLVFVLLLITVSGGMCIRFIRNKASKYERLDMELPVSGVASSELNTNTTDGWDNGWGDDWEDEEAPSLPVTPSVSSKGLAARKLNKDGWKD